MFLEILVLNTQNYTASILKQIKIHQNRSQLQLNLISQTNVCEVKVNISSAFFDVVSTNLTLIAKHQTKMW